MIGIISEYKYSPAELKALKGKAVVNYLLLPQFYQSYADEISKINYQLIRKMNGIIFRIEEYYSGTKEAIEYALYLKKSIKIITPDGTYKLNTLDEWKKYYKDSNNKNVSIKHQVLIDFNRKRSEYYAVLNTIKLKQQYETAVADITETPQEVERFVRAFAPQYKLDVNYSDWVELYTVYKQILFYYNNNIPYDLDHNEVFTKGLIEPEESIYFTKEMFDDTDSTYEYYELESYGDLNYLEDVIYKGGVETCQQLYNV